MIISARYDGALRGTVAAATFSVRASAVPGTAKTVIRCDGLSAPELAALGEDLCLRLQDLDGTIHEQQVSIPPVVLEISPSDTK